jgi:hypothetical protein
MGTKISPLIASRWRPEEFHTNIRHIPTTLEIFVYRVEEKARGLWWAHFDIPYSAEGSPVMIFLDQPSPGGNIERGKYSLKLYSLELPAGAKPAREDAKRKYEGISIYATTYEPFSVEVTLVCQHPCALAPYNDLLAWIDHVWPGPDTASEAQSSRTYVVDNLYDEAFAKLEKDPEFARVSEAHDLLKLKAYKVARDEWIAQRKAEGAIIVTRDLPDERDKFRKAMIRKWEKYEKHKKHKENSGQNQKRLI